MNVILVSDPRLHTFRPGEHLGNLELQCDCACDCGYAPAPDYLDTPPLAVPTIYALELTSECNNQCPGCGNVFANGRENQAISVLHKPLSSEYWKDILEIIAPHAQSIRLTGGEPTLHPQFELILEAVQRHRLSFSVFSNGRWKEPERLLALLKDSHQFTGLLISLHGANADAHESFTGARGSFPETLRNIRRAVEAGLTVHTNTVLTSRNCFQVEEIATLAQSLGAKCAVFNRQVGRPVLGLELALPDLRRAVFNVDRLSQAGHCVRLGTCIPLCFAGSSSTGCLAGIAFCTIDPWGNVRPCNHAPQTAGNLLQDPLETVWRSETMQAWRALVPAECETCSAFAICHGGCRADAVLKGTEHDVLVRTPLRVGSSTLPASERKLCLYEMAIPRVKHTFDQMAFDTIPVEGYIPSDCAYSVLEAIRQPVTLRDLGATLGNKAVDFVGHLYASGLVSLTW